MLGRLFGLKLRFIRKKLIHILTTHKLDDNVQYSPLSYTMLLSWAPT